MWLPAVPPLFWVVLRMMTLAVPTPDPIGRHGELGAAITAACLSEERTAIDKDPEICASVLVGLGTYESGLKKDAIGDGGHSVGAFQQYDGDRELLADADLAVRTALKMIRPSRKVDPAHPLAFYARGPRYKSEEARALSDHRTRLAKRLLDEARAGK